ncbi:MAG TPA: hypothetical protein VJS44_08860, partial [Pyrinomonadaceae bacterium]|nr:hypothetical protein [Pyrinomonadaceae bacterium]
SGVMREINSRPAARSSMFAAWREMFAARPALTVSLAALALFCALSFVAYRSLVKQETRLAAIDESMARLNLELPSVGEARPPVIKDAAGNSAGPSSFTARNTERRRPLRGTEEKALPGAASATQAPDVAVSTTATTAEQTPTQVVARMDIQTSDPNIRIIWLARKPGE